MRSIVHAVLFLTFFYLGFIRKWKRHSITTHDQDNQKIREVVTTWIARHGGGRLGNDLKPHSGGGFSPYRNQTPMRGREAFAAALRSALVQVRIGYSGDLCCWRLRLLPEPAFSDGDSTSGRACPTARWSNVVSLPQRTGRTLDSLSRCEHGFSSMNAAVPQLRNEPTALPASEPPAAAAPESFGWRKSRRNYAHFALESRERKE